MLLQLAFQFLYWISFLVLLSIPDGSIKFITSVFKQEKRNGIMQLKKTHVQTNISTHTQNHRPDITRFKKSNFRRVVVPRKRNQGMNETKIKQRKQPCPCFTSVHKSPMNEKKMWCQCCAQVGNGKNLVV